MFRYPILGKGRPKPEPMTARRITGKCQLAAQAKGCRTFRLHEGAPCSGGGGAGTFAFRSALRVPLLLHAAFHSRIAGNASLSRRVLRSDFTGLVSVGKLPRSALSHLIFVPLRLSSSCRARPLSRFAGSEKKPLILFSGSGNAAQVSARSVAFSRGHQPSNALKGSEKRISRRFCTPNCAR